MPAARTPTRREIAQRATRRLTGQATRERLHALAWAAHAANERPTPHELASRLSVHVTTVHRHAMALRKAGRRPWAAGRWAEHADHGGAEARARRLVAMPCVGPILSGAVAHASRRSPRLADEFESHAWAALWTIALGYRVDSPMAWPAYLRVKLRNSLADFRRQWMHLTTGRKERGAMFSIDVMKVGADGEPSSLAEELPSEDSPVGWDVDSADSVQAMTSSLVGVSRGVIRAIYSQCSEDRAELAARLGTTAGAMATHHYLGIEMIRANLAGREIGRAAG